MNELLGACDTGDLRLVKKLLRRDPSLLNKKCGDGGWFPLLVACENGHEGTTRLLLEKSAVIDLAAYDGATALCMACQNGHEETARLLLEKGAAIDLAAYNGATALCMACQNDHEGIALLLLEKGAAVDLANNNGATPL